MLTELNTQCCQFIIKHVLIVGGQGGTERKQQLSPFISIFSYHQQRVHGLPNFVEENLLVNCLKVHFLSVPPQSLHFLSPKRDSSINSSSSSSQKFATRDCTTIRVQRSILQTSCLLFSMPNLGMLTKLGVLNLYIEHFQTAASLVWLLFAFKLEMVVFH